MPGASASRHSGHCDLSVRCGGCASTPGTKSNLLGTLNHDELNHAEIRSTDRTEATQKKARRARPRELRTRPYGAKSARKRYCPPDTALQFRISGLYVECSAARATAVSIVSSPLDLKSFKSET